MHIRNNLGLALSAAALFGAAATSQAAEPFSLNFDGPGSTASAFAPIFLTIGYGTFVPDLDEFGDEIPGTEHWEIDPTGGAVPVLDPSTVNYGPAPSPSKALDARDGTVLFVFDTPFSITNFSATLDNSGFGNLFDTDIKFYDEDDNLLFSAPVDQTVPGFVVNVGLVNEVKTIAFSPTAFYDNITVVPEPGSVAALLGGAGLLLGLRRRRA